MLSDFGLVHDAVVFGKPFPARAWGVEHLDPGARIARLLAPASISSAVRATPPCCCRSSKTAESPQERVQDAAVRVVELNLRLTGDAGNAPSAPDAADLPLREHVELGMLAQSRSITVLHNGLLGDQRRAAVGRARGEPTCAASTPLRCPTAGVSPNPPTPTIAIVRLAAPFEPRDHYFLESGMEQGSLEFAPEVIDELRSLAAQTALIVAVTLSRPAILTQIAEFATAIVADYGASDDALLDALTGVVTPEGRLPFELPRSMAAVAASRPDVAGDTARPAVPCGVAGHGGDPVRVGVTTVIFCRRDF